LDFPRPWAFTLVLDDDSKCALIGGEGTSASSVLSPTPNGFRTSSPVKVTLPFARSCTGVATILFDELSFVAPLGELAGSGRGTVSYQSGDDLLSASIAMGFEGPSDRTPPTLTVPTALVDPLAPLSFVASEPLPAAVTAKLVGAASGEVVALEAVRLEGPERAIRAFGKPDRMLRFGETYDFVVDGLADFAGNAGSDAPPAAITTRPSPPLAAPDGFESVAGDTFGGAGVLAGGPLPAISGQKSLLLNTGFGGGFGFLPYCLGPSLTVRLAVPRGAKVVRFERQLVAPDPIDAATFVGALRLAAVGHPVEATMNLAATGFSQRTLPGAGDVYVSGTETIELPLPAGATDEVTFEIDGVTFQCGLPPSPTLVVLDDLRVE
jgi:hypothetical protein